MLGRFVACQTRLQVFNVVERAEIASEALSWSGTPYELRAMVKGVGVDCGLLPYAVYRKFGLVTEFEVEKFSSDWFCHTTDERYLLMISRYLRKLVAGNSSNCISAVADGCLALVKTAESRVFNHAGVVTRWPMLIHAIPDRAVETNATSDEFWRGHEIVIFDPLAGYLPR